MGYHVIYALWIFGPIGYWALAPYTFSDPVRFSVWNVVVFVLLASLLLSYRTYRRTIVPGLQRAAGEWPRTAGTGLCGIRYIQPFMGAYLWAILTIAAWWSLPPTGLCGVDDPIVRIPAIALAVPCS